MPRTPAARVNVAIVRGRAALDRLHSAPRENNAIAATISAMLADRSRLATMGLAARSHALSEFGVERVIAATEAAYGDALAARTK